MLKFILSTLVAFFLAFGVKQSSADELRIYIDADFSNVTSAVAEAIELGLRSALVISDDTVGGHPVVVVPMDHKGNPRRSRANIEKISRDPHAIAVFGGMQSPPYLTFGSDVNAAGMPLLLPWSAAAPLTRFANGDANFIFRLSVDDAKVGPFLVNAAIDSGCQRIGLVLVDTGWGRANLKTMTSAFETALQEPVKTIVVSPGLGAVGANNAVRDLKAGRADCVISVLTVKASIMLATALNELAPEIEVLSHWGAISSQFTDSVTASALDEMNFRVVQTCGLNVEVRGSPALDTALEAARVYRPGVSGLRDLSAPAGFVHAFDLGLLFGAAIEQAQQSPMWSEGIVKRRRAFRDAMENLSTPVEGILGTYNRPFSAVFPGNPDGHEALGSDDLCLARFGAESQLVAVDLASRERR